MAAKPWNVVNLILPVGEKEYVIEPIGYRDGLTLLATHVKDPEKGLDLGDDGEVLYRHCMGPVWDQMLTDGCAYPVIERASLAAIQYQTALVQGADCATAAELAEVVWEKGLDPEALAAVMAASQTTLPAPATSTTSTGTAAAAKTPRRASSSGTRSPKATPRTSLSAAQAKPRRSTGRPSSTAGRSS